MQWYFSWVLLLQSAAAMRLPLDAEPVVAGTLVLEPKEEEGQAPLFVDAFLDADGLHTTVILSYSPLYIGNVTDSSQIEKWNTAHWVCNWYSPHHDFVSLQRGVMLQQTQADWTPGEFNASDVTLQMQWVHHSMVVGCPLPSGSPSISSMQLDIEASRNGEELYARRGITVQRTAFVKPGTDLALCTMVDGVHGAALVRPWVKYHIFQGFQQILIYVESRSTLSTEVLVHDLVQSGHVTIVPFYFGKASDKNRFYLQAAMEQHCLFQARGRAAWLGHSDVDEFFELRPNFLGVRSSLRDFLSRVPPKVVTVEPRSQMWMWKGNTSFWTQMWKALDTFPCSITCKVPGYFRGIRTKWIARPGKVRLFDPHHVTPTPGLQAISPDPDLELRLNHFRHCEPDRSGCEALGQKGQVLPLQQCKEDNSFSVYCATAMSALGPAPWKR